MKTRAFPSNLTINAENFIDPRRQDIFWKAHKFRPTENLCYAYDVFRMGMLWKPSWSPPQLKLTLTAYPKKQLSVIFKTLGYHRLGSLRELLKMSNWPEAPQSPQFCP